MARLRARIVIADDHQGMLQHMVELLRDEFEVVATAQSGEYALDAVRQFLPDILILDVAMSPVNGFEVARVLRKEDAAIAMIMVSGYDDPEIRKQAIAAGADAFITKSRLHEDLLVAVRKIIKRLSESQDLQGHKQQRKGPADGHS